MKKNISKNSILLLVAILMFGLLSCSKDDDGGSGGIVGTWDLVSSQPDSDYVDYATVMIFKSDGTYKDIYQEGDSGSGTWKTDGNKITTISDDFPIPFTMTFSISGDELILEGIKYKRRN